MIQNHMSRNIYFPLLARYTLTPSIAPWENDSNTEVAVAPTKKLIMLSPPRK